MRSAGSSPSISACSSSSVTGASRSIMGSPSFSFYAAQRRAPAVEIGFDLYARARQTGHDGTDRNALHLGDLAVAQSLEHHEQQGVTLIFDKCCKRAFNVAPARFRTGKVRGVVILNRRQHGPPGQ